MAASAIHVVPDDSFDDWVVRGDIGNEFGHYVTREAAELAAQAIARELETKLCPTGEGSARVLPRGGWPDC